MAKPQPKQRCVECGALSPGNRCEAHAIERRREHERSRVRPNSTARGYDYAWRKLAKEAIALQPYCSLCGATEDLTGDHIDPNKRTGLTLADVDVLCRAHNAAKKNRPA